MSLYTWKRPDGWEMIGTLEEAKESGQEFHMCGVDAREQRENVSPYVVGDFLHKEERDRIFTQTGEHIDSYSELKSYYKRTGLRSMEKGEKEEVSRREIKEWERSGGEGPAPGEQTPNWGQNRNSVDIKELYRRIKSR